jgi:hypothetical protein
MRTARLLRQSERQAQQQAQCQSDSRQARVPLAKDEV